MAAELRRRLGQAVEPRRQPHVEVPGPRERRPAHEGGGEACLGELLLGVVEEPGRRQPRVGRQRLLGAAQALIGLVDPGLGFGGLEPVHGPDGEAARPDGLPARRQRRLAGPVRRLELVASLVAQPRQIGRARLGRHRVATSASGAADDDGGLVVLHRLGQVPQLGGALGGPAPETHQHHHVQRRHHEGRTPSGRAGVGAPGWPRALRNRAITHTMTARTSRRRLQASGRKYRSGLCADDRARRGRGAAASGRIRMRPRPPAGAGRARSAEAVLGQRGGEPEGGGHQDRAGAPEHAQVLVELTDGVARPALELSAGEGSVPAPPPTPRRVSGGPRSSRTPRSTFRRRTDPTENRITMGGWSGTVRGLASLPAVVLDHAGPDQEPASCADARAVHRPPDRSTVTGTSKHADTAADVSTVPASPAHTTRPPAQQCHVRRPRGDLLDVVGDEHEGHGVGRGCQRGDAGHEPFPGTEVETRRRLVEEQELGRPHERPGQEHLLALAFGQHPELLGTRGDPGPPRRAARRHGRGRRARSGATTARGRRSAR